MPPSRLIVCLLVVGALALSGLCFVFYHIDPLYQPVIDGMEGDNTQTIVPTDPGPNPDEERLVPPTPSTTAGECPPTLSIRVALVGNEYLQQLPLVGYGGIEAAVENLARGVANYIDTAGKREYGDWCAKGWVEIKELIVVVPKRSQTTDLNGNPYPFRVLDTGSGPRTPPSQWIGEVREILEVERPDVIWSQSGWSANGLRDLGIPIICTIHDSGDKQFSFGGADKNLLHYRFVSASQRERWARSDQERAASSVLWQGLADGEYVLGNETERGHYLYVSGRWERHKGIDDVLELAKLNPHDLFRAYGSSDLEDELHEFSRTHANFLYAPDLKRGEDHLNAFRNAKGLLMFTRLPEAFGRVTIEAMSKGTPVFGTRNGANSELITPEVGFISDSIQEVNEHLHDKFNHTLIYELARQRHHVGVEVRGMLDISHKMLRKQF